MSAVITVPSPKSAGEDFYIMHGESTSGAEDFTIIPARETISVSEDLGNTVEWLDRMGGGTARWATVTLSESPYALEDDEVTHEFIRSLLTAEAGAQYGYEVHTMEVGRLDPAPVPSEAGSARPYRYDFAETKVLGMIEHFPDTRPTGFGLGLDTDEPGADIAMYFKTLTAGEVRAAVKAIREVRA